MYGYMLKMQAYVTLVTVLHKKINFYLLIYMKTMIRAMAPTPSTAPNTLTTTAEVANEPCCTSTAQQSHRHVSHKLSVLIKSCTIYIINCCAPCSLLKMGLHYALCCFCAPRSLLTWDCTMHCAASVHVSHTSLCNMHHE